MNIVLKIVEGWRDPNLPFVMDILQESFPPNEQMRLSWWMQRLNEITEGVPPEGEKHTLLAAVDEDTGDVVGFAYYETYTAPPDKPVAYLYYLAMRADARGQGVGTSVYTALMRRVLDQEQCAVVLFEVEKPEVLETHSVAGAEIARRRIGWYKRNGARLLNGIHYSQSVGWQPEVEMNVMFHPRGALSPENAFRVGRTVWMDNIQQVDLLEWDT